MKKFFSLIIVLIVLISLASVSACSTSASADIKSLQSQIESLERENAEIKGETFVDNDLNTDPQTTTSATIFESSSQYTTAAINQNISVPDVCEFAITGVSFGDIIEPPKPGDFFSYYEISDTSNTYTEVFCSLKNLGTSDVQPDDSISAILKFAGKYEYSCFIVGESGQGSDFDMFPFIAPLTTANLHFLFEVPDSVAQSTDPLDCIVNVDGTEYLIKLR